MPILSRYSASTQPALRIPQLVSRSYSNAQNDELERTKFKQSQDYFNQYIEEYYEDDQEEEQQSTSEKPKDEPCVDSLDGLVTILRQERAQNIVVLALGHDGPGVVDIMVRLVAFITPTYMCNGDSSAQCITSLRAYCGALPLHFCTYENDLHIDLVISSELFFALNVLNRY
ncbi:unnamed protein product [Cylicostephanus goldi]|uniref:Uncharacterized protein n=1 Tax=Cylicostephanus goldi TaxID=71465 RepID=A0A3P6TIQ0_CYLGO|nr:unnamed protein product [Cylicostephanus goldi]